LKSRAAIEKISSDDSVFSHCRFVAIASQCTR